FGKRNWREDANGAAAGCDARTRGELLVRSAHAGFEEGRVAARAVQGKTPAGKTETHRIGAADVGGNTAGEIPVDRAEGSGEVAKDCEGPRRKGKNKNLTQRTQRRCGEEREYPRSEDRPLQERRGRMKYYLIAELEITDQSWVADYIKNVSGLVERHGGRYLARTPKVERIEGERKPAGIVE